VTCEHDYEWRMTSTVRGTCNAFLEGSIPEFILDMLKKT